MAAIGIDGRTPRVALSENARGLVFFFLSLAVVLAAWEAYVRFGFATKLLPAPSAVAGVAFDALKSPFYNNGENDKGIGLHLFASLWRVSLGFGIATCVAVPLGIALGLSNVATRALDPYVQILRPVSPLAWLPIGLALFKSSQTTAIFVIAISSVWPILLNTMFGVRAIPKIYLDVARTLGTSRRETLLRIVLPAAAPSIVGGLRVGIGIAWLVIIAAEMLTGGTGIGYYVWNEWNNLSIASIITAILVIGGVGLGLDRLFAILQAKVAYAE
ncbi:MAG: nitrate ABC transporter permease [Vulcanimicrobiaceae bacterium]